MNALGIKRGARSSRPEELRVTSWRIVSRQVMNASLLRSLGPFQA